MSILRDEDNAIPAWIRASALRIATQALVALDRTSECLVLLQQHMGEVGVSGLLAEAELRRKMGEREAELQLLEQAAAANLSEALPGEREELANRLIDHERFGLACAIFEQMKDADRSQSTDRMLVYATYRTGDKRAALQKARSYIERYGYEARVVHMELDLMELDDPETAVSLIDRYLAFRPEDRLMRLRRAVLGSHFAKPEWLENSPDALPIPDECEPRNGRLAARILAEAGNADGALRYAFALFRSHFDSGEARQALLDVIYRAAEPPTIPRPEIIGVDCAVHIRDDVERSYFVVIEAGGQPNQFRDEYAPDSAIAQAVLGKKVGDEVKLPRADSWGRHARVELIESKYLFWVRKISQPMAGGMDADGAMISIPLGEPKEMLTRVRRMVADHRANRQDFLAFYRQYDLCSMHLLAQKLGYSTYEAMLVFLSSGREAIRTTAQFAPVDLGQSTLVFDQTALATLVFLERHTDLSLLEEQQLATSPDTAASVRRFATSPSMYRTHMSVTLDGVEALSGVEFSAEYLQAVRTAAASVAKWVDANLLTLPSREVAEVDPKQRKAYSQMLGRGGLECLVIALDGNVLVTDDQVQGQLARKLGARVVSSLHLLTELRRCGILDEDEFLRSKLRLMGAGYLGIGVSGAEVFQAGTMADWRTHIEPLASILSTLENRNIAAGARVGIGASVIAAALRFLGDTFTRDCVIDQVLVVSRTLGLVDDSFNQLVHKVRSLTRDDENRIFDRILSSRWP